MVLFFSACQQKSNGLSSDIVKNSASAQGDSNLKPIMTFEKTEHDFGDIMQGEVVVYSFKFTNTGNADLIISGARTSCGCTVSDYPRDPVKPGQSAYVKVKFDSEGKSGKNYKTITLSTNCTPSEVVLTIKANVIVP
jgi:hypothetical protein